MNNIFISNIDTSYKMSTVYSPKPNGWKLYLCGHGTPFSTVIHLMNNTKPPCWFHRKMQRFMLGIIWVYEPNLKVR